MSLNRWQTAVLHALQRFSCRHGSRLVPRKQLIAEELTAILAEVGSQGKTPKYTLSRVLQKFRQSGVLHHVERGIDLLLDSPLNPSAESYSGKVLDIAIEQELFLLEDVPTADTLAIARQRRGQARLRKHTLANYSHRCAVCDVAERTLLVASHIVRWSDDLQLRGKLSNLLCLCRMHDALFETGHIAFSDDFKLLKSRRSLSTVVRFLQETTLQLRLPASHSPNPAFLRRHRERIGFDPSCHG